MDKSTNNSVIMSLLRWLAVLPVAFIVSVIFSMVYELLSPILAMFNGLELPSKHSNIFDLTLDVERGGTITTTIGSFLKTLVFVVSGSHTAPSKRGPTAVVLGAIYCVPVLVLSFFGLVEYWERVSLEILFDFMLLNGAVIGGCVFGVQLGYKAEPENISAAD